MATKNPKEKIIDGLNQGVINHRSSFPRGLARAVKRARLGRVISLSGEH